MADARDLKSRGPQGPCRFKSGPGHHHVASDPSSSAQDFGWEFPLNAASQFISPKAKRASMMQLGEPHTFIVGSGRDCYAENAWLF